MMTPDFIDELIPSPRCNSALSTKSLIAQMIKMELAYLKIMGGDIAPYQDFEVDYSLLKAATGRDGVVVPELVRQLRAHHHDPLLHTGMTSQDVTDTAYALAFAELNAMFLEQLDQAIVTMDTLVSTFGNKTITARTRMQAALEVKAAHRLNHWKTGLAQARSWLVAMRPSIERVSLGGPVGDARHWENPEWVAENLADALELSPQTHVWHTLRGNIQNYGNWLAQVSGHNAKIGQDITLMAQQGIEEIRLAQGGASSAMAHKSNPIKAEVLVSLGRLNAGLLGTLAQSVVHEQERSGAAWTLEWMILPHMLQSTEASLRNLVEVLSTIQLIGNDDSPSTASE